MRLIVFARNVVAPGQANACNSIHLLPALRKV
jgi:hypothetical protein